MKPSLRPLVARAGREVRRRPAASALFLFASTLHALGHALIALAGGACARAIAGGLSPMGGGSTPLDAMGFGPRDAVFLGILGLVAVVVKNVAGVTASHVQARLAGEVGADLRLDVLEGWLALHRLRQPRHIDHGAARAGPQARGVAALTSHVRDVERGLQDGVLGGLRAFAQLVPLAVVLVALAPKLAVAAASVLAPFSVALGRARRRWKRAHADASRQTESLLEAADEAVRHADLWTTYGAEARVREHVASLGRAIVRRAAGVEASAAALSGANEILGALALVIALAAGRAGLLGDAFESGTLLAFAVAFFLAYRPLRDLTDARLALARADVALDELAAALDARAQTDPGEAPSAPATDWPLATLELRDVTTRRGAHAPLSFRLGEGKIVAISGPTGSGKTTLLRALLGLEPAVGEITYGGDSLGDAAPGPAHRPFAWVPQDAPLLCDTLRANVNLGGGDDDARDALDAMGASHLEGALGDARLGAGGRAVSGGERQWIALARAVATRQPVLLLDEPTSGLDAAAQQRVLDAIAKLRGRRSIVIVTHRPEPLAIADRVVRLEMDASLSPEERPGDGGSTSRLCTSSRAS